MLLAQPVAITARNLQEIADEHRVELRDTRLQKRPPGTASCYRRGGLFFLALGAWMNKTAARSLLLGPIALGVAFVEIGQHGQEGHHVQRSDQDGPITVGEQQVDPGGDEEEQRLRCPGGASSGEG